jgi:hypothetical protein
MKYFLISLLIVDVYLFVDWKLIHKDRLRTDTYTHDTHTAVCVFGSYFF